MVWQIELMATLPAGAAHNPLALVCKSELSRATWGGAVSRTQFGWSRSDA